MSSKRKFSEVARVYNDNISTINDARCIFQKEINSIGEFVFEHINEICQTRPDEEIYKVRFSRPQDWSTVKDGPWLNYTSGTQISLDVRAPNKKRFSNGVAYIYFETRFDHELGKFVFQARFENQDSIDGSLDERLHDIVKKSGNSVFENTLHVKASTDVLFRKHLTDELFDQLHLCVNAVFKACRQLIDETLS